MRGFIALIAAAGMTFSAAATDISTAADFVSAMTTDPAGDYTLKADIDLSDQTYSIPPCFSGKLDGAGHTISGLPAQFCLTNAGTLVSVTFDGTTGGAVRKLSGTPVGAISIYAENAVYTNVIVKGYSLSTGRSVSGLFTAHAKGAMRFFGCATAADCVIEKGSNNNNNSGGFIGSLSGVTTADAVFECCTNNATMYKMGNANSSNATAGFVASATGGNVKASGYPSLRFVKCVNNGSITATGGLGNMSGFVGITYLSTAGAGTGTFRIVIVDCINNGQMDSATYNVSKAVGFIVDLGSGVTFYMTNCVNRATIGGTTVSYASGFVGSMTQHICTMSDAKSVFVNCANYGAISGVKAAGLFVTGATGSGMKNANVPGFYNCANYGTITGSTCAGEFAAETTTYFSYALDNCYSATDNYVGTVSGTVTTKNMHGSYETDYDATNACTELSARADECGWNRWWRVGKASGKPELLQWSGDTVVVCRIRYFDWDGSVFLDREVEKGETVASPKNPSRSGYVFTGWDKTITVVTEDVDVNATYRARESGEIGCAVDFISDMTADPAASYQLSNDIDFGGSGFATVSAFSGSLDGNGFTVKGIGTQALFGTLSGSIVNLTLDGEEVKISGSAGTDIGALCNTMDGGAVSNVVVRNYEIKAGKTNSGQGAGAFAGLARGGAEFVCCETAADVACSDAGCANVNVGGMVGRIANDSSVQATGETARFVNCTNRADVMSTGGDNSSQQGMGGFVGKMAFSATTATDVPAVKFVGCVNFGNVNVKATMPAAGFVARQVHGGKGHGVLTFENCANYGTITYSGSDVTTGGQAGGFVAVGATADLVFDSCVNRGEIAFGQRGSVSGFVGYDGLRLDVSYPTVMFTNCANYADVYGSRAAGLVGYLSGNTSAHANGFRMVNCANYGAITGPTNSAEFVAYAAALTGQIVEMDNLFSITTNVYDYLTFSANESNAIRTHFVSAADEGYDAKTACKTLNDVAAAASGYGPWVLGKADDETLRPELKSLCRNPFKSIGLLLLVR